MVPALRRRQRGLGGEGTEHGRQLLGCRALADPSRAEIAPAVDQEFEMSLRRFGIDGGTREEGIDRGEIGIAGSVDRAGARGA